MTDKYSIAEARQDLAALVRKLERQPFIEITRRGKPVAVLLSIEEFQRLSKGGTGFWQAYTAFRQEANLAGLQIDPGLVFEGVRPAETGREVEL